MAEVKIKNGLVARLVKKSIYGNTPVVQIRYEFEPWGNWFFATSSEEKKNWIYIPELGIWRSNISIG